MDTTTTDIFEQNFKAIYLSHYEGMVRFAREYVVSVEEAENIVHDSFAELWEVREKYIHKMKYLLAFLFTSIKNKCIDYLRHEIVVKETEDMLQQEYRLSMQMKYYSLEAFNEDVLSDSDLDELIYKAIASLPDKCREIFVKNKFEGKRQKEIARELNISINTVENHMAVAYKKLKQELKDYLPLLIFLLYV